MTTTYQFSIDELSAEFIQKIRNFHQKGFVTMSVDSVDETEYLLQSPINKEILLQSIAQAEAGNLIAVDMETLHQ